MNNLVIPENTPVGTVVDILKASDPENSSIRYDLHGTDVLKVDHQTGEVTVIKSLDYEVRINYYPYELLNMLFIELVISINCFILMLIAIV